MIVKEAIDITKKFIKDKQTYSPILASDWTFKMVFSRVCLESKSNNILLDFTSLENYSANFIFEDTLKIIDNKLKGNYYLTSIGLIDEITYFEAEDIVERYSNKIAVKDLEIGCVYHSDKGGTYLHIGKLNITGIIQKENVLIKDTIETDEYVLNLTTDKLVKVNSLKLTRKLALKELKRRIDLSNNILKINNRYSYIQLNTKIENITFAKFNYNNLDNVIHYKGVEEFISSEEREFNLPIKKKKGIDFDTFNEEDLFKLIYENGISHDSAYLKMLQYLK